VAAFTCGWIAIATAQRAYVPACKANAVKGITHRFQFQNVQPRVICASAFGMRWRSRPTVAMAFAILVALGFGLIAISPKQGSSVLYRGRRVVY
jgi:hypothetical protein